MATYIVTGTAGFIGFHLAKRLLEQNHKVIGIDNLNDYYDPNLKLSRNAILEQHNNYTFHKADLADYESILQICKNSNPEQIIHLAAQAGVRYSLENPWTYVRSNELGTLNIFEAARHTNIKKIVYASSSSVYGGNEKIPFSEDDPTDHPVSLYAATKKSNEGLAHAYSHLYDITAIGLRFFTVYGPWGRPDMAPWIFTQNILNDIPIRVFNNGKMQRDFTFIQDIVDGITQAMHTDLKTQLFNLGNDDPVELLDFIKVIEKALDKKAILNLEPMQPGDVVRTYADLTKSRKLLNYDPKTNIKEGMKQTVEWFIKNRN